MTVSLAAAAWASTDGGAAWLPVEEDAPPALRVFGREGGEVSGPSAQPPTPAQWPAALKQEGQPPMKLLGPRPALALLRPRPVCGLSLSRWRLRQTLRGVLGA